MSRTGLGLALVGLVGLSLAGGLAGASAQPIPVCPVCGESFHENVTATDATISIQPDGDVRWQVENRVADPTASEWRTNPDRVREQVTTTVDHPHRPPYDPTGARVDVTNETVTIRFVDRGAAKERLGLLVLPYFVRGQWLVNADRLSVEAPPGSRIVGTPELGQAGHQRVVWTGESRTRTRPNYAPVVEDTYVVTGSGPTAGLRGAIATSLMPLDFDLYVLYAFGLLFVGAAAYAIYAFEDHRLDGRGEAIGLAVSVLPYVWLIGRMHPADGGFFAIFQYGFAFLLGLLGALICGAGMAVWADKRSTRTGTD